MWSENINVLFDKNHLKSNYLISKHKISRNILFNVNSHNATFWVLLHYLFVLLVFIHKLYSNVCFILLLSSNYSSVYYMYIIIVSTENYRLNRLPYSRAFIILQFPFYLYILKTVASMQFLLRTLWLFISQASDVTANWHFSMLIKSTISSYYTRKMCRILLLFFASAVNIYCINRSVQRRTMWC